MQAAETAIVAFLFVNSIYDIKRREIILVSVAVMDVLGFILSLLVFKRSIYEIAIGIIPGAVLFICACASAGKLGCGDALVMITVGIWQGFIRTVYILFTALLIASFVSLCLLIANSKQRDIPFIPFVCMGQMITWIF